MGVKRVGERFLIATAGRTRAGGTGYGAEEDWAWFGRDAGAELAVELVGGIGGIADGELFAKLGRGVFAEFCEGFVVRWFLRIFGESASELVVRHALHADKKTGGCS